PRCRSRKTGTPPGQTRGIDERRPPLLLFVLLAVHLPDLDQAIRAGRGQPLAIGAEGHGMDRCLVTLEDIEALPAGHLPQPDLPVRAARGQELAVRAEGDAVDQAAVPGNGGRVVAAVAVPQAQRVVRAA